MTRLRFLVDVDKYYRKSRLFENSNIEQILPKILTRKIQIKLGLNSYKLKLQLKVVARVPDTTNTTLRVKRSCQYNSQAVIIFSDQHIDMVIEVNLTILLV